MPASPAIGKALYAASLDAVNYGDRWLGRALHIAAHRHRDFFLTEYRADPRALPPDELPVALRIGENVPDWRTPNAASLASDWKPMEVPGSWESRGLEDFDGVVWFTRTVKWPAKGAPRTLALGRVGNAAQVWVNGQPLARPPAAPGGWRAPVVFPLAKGVLKPGVNTITVRIGNLRREGGFLDSPDAMYIEGDQKLPLAGTWQYRVERQTNAASLYGRPGELAAHVASAASPESGERGLTVAEPTPAAPADAALKIGAVPHELKFDKTELTVKAGQFVELVFVNPDVMQHNFLLGAPGSLDRIGAAADAMMTGPEGPAQQYVPAIPEVLFATTLVDPGQTLTVQFKAPEEPGEYPYVCTFPGHWRVMNGIMHVTP
jgi:azurin